MKAKAAKGLAEHLIVDIDGVLSHQPAALEDRHSAAASALITVARLFGGYFVNQARIAQALEDIADKLYEEETNAED